MRVGSFFRKRKHQGTLPAQSVLRNQVTFAIRTYLGVCGLQALLQRETLLVVRENFDIFLMHGPDGLENPTNVIGLFPIKDADCFEEFKKVHSDPLLRSGALGKMTLGHLATQLAERITQHVKAPRAPTAIENLQPRARQESCSVLLTVPATMEPK
jgi:hypothetical protein